MIAPDTKDWTWVLDRVCPGCGFDASACAAPEVAVLVRTNATSWQRLLDLGGIRSGRPNDVTWSPLEYACHVRDVFRRYDGRVALMLTEDDPLYPNWDQDASAVEDRYEEQDPAEVVTDLIAAAERLATRLDRISGAEWDRPGRRSDGASFTVSTIARYMVHDPIHHLWDVSGAGA
jgi:DinB superfamily